MATITVRGIDEQTHECLKARAAHHGRSMEAEVRAILTETVDPRPNQWFADWVAQVRGEGEEIPLTSRSAPRQVDFA
jgi:plasmid stability protein